MAETQSYSLMKEAKKKESNGIHEWGRVEGSDIATYYVEEQT